MEERWLKGDGIVEERWRKRGGNLGRHVYKDVTMQCSRPGMVAKNCGQLGHNI